MARWHGRVGYGKSKDVGSGVWVDDITEHSYYGDVFRNMRFNNDTGEISPKLSVSNLISLVADAYANDNFLAIRYVEWMGVLWTVSNVDVQSPRLLLTLGEVYNGPVPE